MSHIAAESFIQALAKLESSQEVTELLDLFADDSQVSNQVLARPFMGKDGARRFWKDYRALFQDVRSKITRVHDFGSVIALEWETQGTLMGGTPIHYPGISLLECENGKIKRFKAWFDSAVFLATKNGKHAHSEAA